MSVGDDSKNQDACVVYLRQSGLGVPDRECYLAERFKPQRDGYREYVGLVLKEAGWGGCGGVG